MEPARDQGAGGADAPGGRAERPFLSAQELLAGSLLMHDVAVPDAVLRPGGDPSIAREALVRLRPLTVATLALISKAAREDPTLVPLLVVKESLAEPAMSLEQIRQMHAGLVHFLVAAINRISGLDPDQASARTAAASPIGEAHLQLARHFGWTPAQVAELTPGQVSAYLAGIQCLPAAGVERGSAR
jgi:hypothetical protein